jgi:nicotinamide mononucleotide adenylyltransferase
MELKSNEAMYMLSIQEIEQNIIHIGFFMKMSKKYRYSSIGNKIAEIILLLREEQKTLVKEHNLYYNDNITINKIKQLMIDERHNRIRQSRTRRSN